MSRSKRSRRQQPDGPVNAMAAEPRKPTKVLLADYQAMVNQHAMACRDRDEANEDARHADKELADLRERIVVRATWAGLAVVVLMIAGLFVAYFDGKATREEEFQFEIAGSVTAAAFDERTGEFHYGFNRPQLCYFDRGYQSQYTSGSDCIDAPTGRVLTDSGDTDEATFALIEQRAGIEISDYVCSEGGCTGGTIWHGNNCVTFSSAPQ